MCSPARMNSSFMASGIAMWSVNWGSRYFTRSSTAQNEHESINKTHFRKKGYLGILRWLL